MPQIVVRADVVDELGAPLSGARMVVGYLHELATAHAMSRAPGDWVAGPSDAARIRGDEGPAPRLGALIAANGKAAYWHPDAFAKTPVVRGSTMVWDLGEVRLPDGVTLTGTVRNKSGERIHGARVTAQDCVMPYQQVTPSFVSLATTTTNGVFVLAGALPEGMQLVVQADGYYTQVVPTMTVGDPLEVVLDESGYVEGRVHNADGQPWDGVIKNIYEFPEAVSPTVSCRNGQFRIGITTRCRFRTAAYDEHGFLVEGPVLKGPTTGVRLCLGAKRQGLALLRAANCSTGKPVRDIKAMMVWRQPGVEGMSPTLKTLGFQRSATDGGVGLRLVPHSQSGVGSLHVLAPGFAPYMEGEVRVAEGEEITARLQPESRIRGQVVDAGSGEPIEGASVSVELSEPKPAPWLLGPLADYRTDREGRFELSGLGQGTYEVTAGRRPGSVKGSTPVTLGQSELRAGVRIAVPVGLAVSGSVVGARGNKGWKIRCRRIATEANGGAIDTKRVAIPPHEDMALADGTFRFTGRAPGVDELILVIPTPVRDGPALEIPVMQVQVEAADVDVQVDVAEHAPGVIAGRLNFTGMKAPPGRFAVVATRRSESRRSGGMRERIERMRWSIPRSNGCFTVTVAAGQYTMEVVDITTGVVFAQTEEHVVVTPGGTAVWDMGVEVVEMRVQLESEDNPLPCARRLEISCGGHTPGGTPTLFGRFGGSPGVDLLGMMQDVQVIVPPGPITVCVDSGASRISDGVAHVFGDRPQVVRSVVAQAGGKVAVTMDVPVGRTLAEQ